MNVAMTLLCVNSMLELLSKTKLCQGARRVLRLMKRRVGQVQVRDALKVLTLLMHRELDLNLTC
ncbi:hypothetical protein Bca52824_072971 [Brassica carinata]|uniref:Uncharacterized protein n=1 Tax=Brassica carinata TaxID=52824 RepID=A0A8X7U4S2_BRACI|nr:hypothetical protein Bca52824_072971 [Brassica carinata]